MRKCTECLKVPTKNLMKTLVILVCTGVVMQQLITCIQKLVVMPVTTYTHFDFNSTMLYPSVTLCREPPYKYSKLEAYGLTAYPMYTSIWRNFDFVNNNLDEMWNNITYSQEDYFVQYGFEGTVNNVAVTPTTSFMTGRCFTVSPTKLATKASRDTGYSIMVQHTADDIATSLSTMPPGYHVYIHSVNEPFTEVSSPNSGLVEYLYVSTGEEVDIKLTVNQYHMLSSEDDPCRDICDSYSANNCTAGNLWRLLERQVGCSGPWMKSTLPRCSNYNDMRALIVAYLDQYQSHSIDRECPRTCHSFFYNAFVVNRHQNYQWDSTTHQWIAKTADLQLQTQLYIHFNSMMVSVYEEQYNYDWNLFLSDIGGNVGFLLGLSVIGLLSIITKVWSSIVGPAITKPRAKSTSDSASSVTAEAKDQDLAREIKEWQKKNDLHYHI